MSTCINLKVQIFAGFLVMVICYHHWYVQFTTILGNQFCIEKPIAIISAMTSVRVILLQMIDFTTNKRLS